MSPITIHNDGNVTYITVGVHPDGSVKQSIRVHEEVVLDLDEKGGLVGIEIL